jgi:inosine-uridine nucleoside N-ribohydrolase
MHNSGLTRLLALLPSISTLTTPPFTRAQSKAPIILDTDIATDIDDSFALALIINSPEPELLGVTTVAGDTQARARPAAKLLWEAGGAWRKVPVYAGQ